VKLSSYLIRIAPGVATVAAVLRLGFTLGPAPAGRVSQAQDATPAPSLPTAPAQPAHCS